MVEGECRGAAGLAGPRPTVDEEQVRPAVAVEVDDGHAGTHRFGQQLVPGSSVEVPELDPGLRRDVRETERRFGRRINVRFRPESNGDQDGGAENDEQAGGEPRPGRTGHGATLRGGGRRTL